MPDAPRFVLDGSNLAKERSQGTFNLKHLREVKTALQQQHPGARLTVVVDAADPHYLRGPRRQALLDASTAGEVVIAPSKVEGKGDRLVILFARDQGAVIVSNDGYGIFLEEFPFLAEPGRVLGAKYGGGTWVFPERRLGDEKSPPRQAGKAKKASGSSKGFAALRGSVELTVAKGSPAHFSTDGAQVAKAVVPPSGALIGRGEAAHLRLVPDPPGVGRRHASIEPRGAHWILWDENSRHGTEVRRAGQGQGIALGRGGSCVLENEMFVIFGQTVGVFVRLEMPKSEPDDKGGTGRPPPTPLWPRLSDEAVKLAHLLVRHLTGEHRPSLEHSLSEIRQAGSYPSDRALLDAAENLASDPAIATHLDETRDLDLSELATVVGRFFPEFRERS